MLLLYPSPPQEVVFLAKLDEMILETVLENSKTVVIWGFNIPID